MEAANEKKVIETANWRELPCFRAVSFVVDMRLRERFRSWALIDEWTSAYPWLFDARDLEILKNPVNSHQVTRGFCEYLAAVLLFHGTGWRSLVRNYEAKSHPDKSALFRAMVGDDVYGAVFSKGGAPDLFVFAEQDEWMFAEVKGPNDVIRVNQVQIAQRLFQMTGKPVLVIELKDILLVATAQAK